MSENRAIDRFYEFLRGILKIYTDLIPVLKDEVENIKNDDTSGLDTSLKLQQAMLLRTRGFDDRVAAYQKELGVSAPNLTSLVALLPEEERFRFYSLVGEFDEAVEQVCFYKDKCRELLQTRLYRIEKQAVNSGLSQNLTYDESASGVNKAYGKVYEKRI